MILQHKTSNKVYNLIGIENNGLELTLKLAYWHKTPKGGYRKATRSTSVYSWEALIEQMSKFEEVGVGEIKATDVKKWLNELELNDDRRSTTHRKNNQKLRAEARHAEIHQKKGAREWQTSKTSNPSLARVWRENSDAKAA